jgi:hypothetical protein
MSANFHNSFQSRANRKIFPSHVDLLVQYLTMLDMQGYVGFSGVTATQGPLADPQGLESCRLIGSMSAITTHFHHLKMIQIPLPG